MSTRTSKSFRNVTTVTLVITFALCLDYVSTKSSDQSVRYILPKSILRLAEEREMVLFKYACIRVCTPVHPTCDVKVQTYSAFVASCFKALTHS